MPSILGWYLGGNGFYTSMSYSYFSTRFWVLLQTTSCSTSYFFLNFYLFTKNHANFNLPSFVTSLRLHASTIIFFLIFDQTYKKTLTVPSRHRQYRYCQKNFFSTQIVFRTWLLATEEKFSEASTLNYFKHLRNKRNFYVVVLSGSTAMINAATTLRSMRSLVTRILKIVSVIQHYFLPFLEAFFFELLFSSSYGQSSK